MNEKQITSYLIRLGMSREEALIYATLVQHGSSTALAISRLTMINRTKVYRTLESLSSKQLVEQEIEENTTLFSPSPIEKIREILRDKQTQVASLTQEFNEFERELAQVAVEKKSSTKVKFYRGIEGIRQMVWNVLKAKSEVVGYTTRDLTDFVGERFMQEFVEEFIRRNLSMRDIYSDEYVKNKKTKLDWGTSVSSRYLPSKALAIPHQMDIYDDVVTFYDYQDGEVWGTEIYNPKVAQVQKQLFDLAWEKAK